MSTFVKEPSGPLPPQNNNYNTAGNIGNLNFLEDDIKVALTALNIFKSCGPDNLHPKILACLGKNDNFVTAIPSCFRIVTIMAKYQMSGNKLV